MDENERFEQVCKPNFERSDRKLDKVLSLLEGNGKPGLVSRIERIEMKCQTASGVLGFLAKNWQIGIVIMILLFNTFSGEKQIDAKQIAELAKEVNTLKVLIPDNLQPIREP